MAASHSAALTGRGAASDQNGDCCTTAPADSRLNALAELRTGLDAPLELRIGLASGPAVGGVIGMRRILLTCGAIRSTSRRAWNRPAFHGGFEPLEVKGLGRMTTYLLADPAP